MEMHGRFGRARRAGGEAEQRDVVAPGLDRLEAHRLVERDAIELGVVIGGAVEADDELQELAVLGAGDQFLRDARVAERERDLGLVDDLRQFACAQHRHRVDDDGAGLGGGEPDRDHRRIVRRADQHPVARLDAIVLDQRMGEPVAPVGEFLVGAPAAVADQRGMVAEAALDHAVGQFDRGVEIFGIVEALEQKVRPVGRRRQIVAGESVDMGGWTEHRIALRIEAWEIIDYRAPIRTECPARQYLAGLGGRTLAWELRERQRFNPGSLRRHDCRPRF